MKKYIFEMVSVTFFCSFCIPSSVRGFVSEIAKFWNAYWVKNMYFLVIFVSLFSFILGTKHALQVLADRTYIGSFAIILFTLISIAAKRYSCAFIFQTFSRDRFILSITLWFWKFPIILILRYIIFLLCVLRYKFSGRSHSFQGDSSSVRTYISSYRFIVVCNTIIELFGIPYYQLCFFPFWWNLTFADDYNMWMYFGCWLQNISQKICKDWNVWD